MKFKFPKIPNIKNIGMSGCCFNPNKAKCTNADSNSESVKTAGNTKDIKNKDMGNAPYILNIEDATEKNNNFRTAIWTGKHMQVVLMSIPKGGDIGIDIHEDTDQFFHIMDGKGEVSMGRLPNNMNYVREVDSDYAFVVPAGTYHNVKNIGDEPLKLYTIYAPPHHPFGTEN